MCRNIFDGGTTARLEKSGGGGKRKKRKKEKRKRTKGGPQFSLIPNFSNGARKYRVRSRGFSQPFAKVQALFITEMIDKEE